MRLFDLAQRFVGEIRERPGATDHPFIVWCLDLCGLPEQHDETPWCSAFLNGCCWILRLPRSKSARARSWLTVGTAVPLIVARIGDVVILKRGAGEQPGPEVIAAPGHVGLFAGSDGDRISLLAGNQGNAVTVATFPAADVLGVRRIEP